MFVEVGGRANDDGQVDVVWPTGLPSGEIRIRVEHLTAEAADCAAKWGLQTTQVNQPIVVSLRLTPASASQRRRGELRFG